MSFHHPLNYEVEYASLPFRDRVLGKKLNILIRDSTVFITNLCRIDP